MTRRLMALLSAIGLVAAVAVGVATPAQASGDQQLKVATYNIYFGADFAPLATAPTQEELVRRAGLAYDQVVATDFPARARAISRLLKQERPHVVGLQEVALWKKGPLSGSLKVTYDFLDILLRELRKAGLHYRAAVTGTTFSTALPISATEQVSFTDRNVVLVQEGVRVANAQSRVFAAKLVVNTPFGVTFTIPSGWAAVDVSLAKKRVVRVATTHLEFADPAVRNAQGQELHAALARSSYPVVAVGDFNSPPTEAAGPYGTFTTEGYDDAWRIIHGPKGGFTSAQDPELRNLPSKLSERIDYVFYQPAHLSAISARLIGEQVQDRTSNGLWPSDHAGLVALLRLKPKVPTKIPAGDGSNGSTLNAIGDSPTGVPEAEQAPTDVRADGVAQTRPENASGPLAGSAIALSALVLLLSCRRARSSRQQEATTQ
ncbi:endonuclease/exonuclease/phosphatase family protein [Micromonospora sp. NPDC023737]|uniref:endonuclease/exonuclease/phosphatase family protein n=1 Tax=unclassified Micromonospora TaxID=2617518 RepID=UPI0033CAD754